MRVVVTVDAEGFGEARWCPVCCALLDEGNYQFDDVFGRGDLRANDPDWEKMCRTVETDEAKEE
jgi:hypothetical protein